MHDDLLKGVTVEIGATDSHRSTHVIHTYITHTLASLLRTLLIRSHKLCIRYSYARIYYLYAYIRYAYCDKRFTDGPLSIAQV